MAGPNASLTSRLSFTRRIVLVLAVVAFGSGNYIFEPSGSLAGEASVPKAARKCITSLNKQLAKIDKKVGVQVKHCTIAHALGKPFDKDEPLVDTIDACVDADRKGKITTTVAKARSLAALTCTDPLPTFAANDVEAVIDAASVLRRELARDVFGADLGALVTRGTDADAAKCQDGTWKAVAKCAQRRIGSFLGCKKKGLARGEIASNADLEAACLMQDGDPQTGQADPKGKIAKACDDPAKGIGKPLAKSCSELSTDALFPGCAGEGSPALCLDRLVACATCEAVNAADGLARNCDAFDNTLDDASCGCGDGILTAAEECDDGASNSDSEANACRSNCLAAACGDAVIDDGEDCDDGNTADGDGCTSSCSIPEPTSSCLTILNDNPGAPDGKYVVSLPSGSTTAHCDMTSAGGGWTRVGILDGETTYCTNVTFTDLRIDPDASAGKIPDSDVQALMADVPASPVEVMFYVPADGRFIWRDLIGPQDFDTSNRHISPAHYCSNWQCDTGGSSFTLCSSEGSGCPVTGHGGAGNTFRKIYIDFDADGLRGGMHTNANLCGLPNYNGEPIWVYVR